MHPETLAALAEVGRRARKGDRIVFVSGNFNVVHPGHLRLLRFAADCGEFLLVGVHDETSKGTHVPEALRLEAVRAISLVDHAFIMRDAVEHIIGTLRPAVVVKGKEHETEPNPETAAVEAYGGKVLFSSGEVRFSSLDLLKREFEDFNPSSIRKPRDFPGRHGFTIEGLKALLRSFNGMRVVVMGDLIVDEYVDCEALGMSQEEPTIVVSPIQNERFIGGAAIVAAHAKGLGADVKYFTVAGADAVAKYATERLEAYGVAATILADDSRPTTLKQRYRAEGKTLLRVSNLRQHDISDDLCARIRGAVSQALGSTDLLVFSDFNYGCLPQALVDAVAEAAASRKIHMVADSQSSSQVGDVSRFRGMLLLTPTEREARLAVRDFSSGLAVLASQLRARARTRNVAITLGVEGVLAQTGDEESGVFHTDQLPSFNSAPKDPAGAGDSFLTCSAMGLAAGADLWRSVFLGSLAAACQVGRVGNIPLSPRDLEAEIDA